METDQHKKQFGNQAKDYTQYRKPYVSGVYELLFTLLPKNASRILDVACGTGKSTEPLIKDGLEVFGVDHDSLMIEEATAQADLKNLDIHYLVAEAEHLPFNVGYFDAVTIGTAFHWFANETALLEMKRVLKDGGLFFVFWTLSTKEVPVEDMIPGEIFQSFKWERVPSELRDLGYISSLLAKNGFERVSMARIPFSHHDTVEDQVGLMKTASNYELLPEDDKKRFIDMIRSALTTQLGERPYFTYEEEVQICYGFK